MKIHIQLLMKPVLRTFAHGKAHEQLHQQFFSYSHMYSALRYLGVDLSNILRDRDHADTWFCLGLTIDEHRRNNRFCAWCRKQEIFGASAIRRIQASISG